MFANTKGKPNPTQSPSKFNLQRNTVKTIFSHAHPKCSEKSKFSFRSSSPTSKMSMRQSSLEQYAIPQTFFIKTQKKLYFCPSKNYTQNLKSLSKKLLQQTEQLGKSFALCHKKLTFNKAHTGFFTKRRRSTANSLSAEDLEKISNLETFNNQSSKNDIHKQMKELKISQAIINERVRPNHINHNPEQIRRGKSQWQRDRKTANRKNIILQVHTECGCQSTLQIKDRIHFQAYLQWTNLTSQK